MPKASFQKKRILILRNLLLEYTDEQHPMTMKQLESYLSANDLKADSRSIIDDLRVLQEEGLDIIMDGKYYYIASREFELPELKILSDCIQASRFITDKKTDDLLKKLEMLCSKHDAEQIRGNIHYAYTKSENEDIYRVIDSIQRAISEGKEISFQYQQYTTTEQLTFRNGGKKYEVLPVALVYNEENYYLIARERKTKHYRVDRIKNLEIKDEKAYSLASRLRFDPITEEYIRQNFSMYSGPLVATTIQFPNSMAGIVIDRFGKKTKIIEKGNGYFQITVNVAISPQFFGWVFGLGQEVKIISPQSVVRQMKALLKDAYKGYTIPRNRKKTDDS